MTDQIIARYDFADDATFRAAFDADAEDRGHASLSVLQVWREGVGTAWVLYQVADPARARAYLDGAQQVFASAGGVTGSEFHMVKTA